MQMDIIQRLYFVLKSLKPTPSATKNTLCILRRIARHSLQSATRIEEHAGLLDAVFAKLNDPSSDALVCTEALKTARIISAWSRSLAQKVLSKDIDFAAFISRHVGIQSGNLGLALESLRLWDTCLRYGFLTDLFTKLYPLIMKYFVALRSQIIEAPEILIVRLDVGAMIMKVTEAYMAASAGSTSKMSDVMEMTMIFIAAMSRNALAIKDKGTLEFVDSCITFINSSLLLEAKHVDKGLTEQRTIEVFEKIELIFSSDLFIELVRGLHSYSAILSELKDGRRRDPKNMPSVGVVCEKASIVPTVEVASPYRILRSFFNLVHSAIMLNKNLAKNKGHYLKNILSGNRDILSYVKAVSTCGKETLISNWFSTDEHIMLLYYILIRQEIGSNKFDNDGDITWQLAQRLMCRLHMKHNIFIKVIFEKVICDFGALQNFTGFASNYGDKIKDIYQKYFPASHESWPCAHENPKDTSTLTQCGAGEQALPSDWTYLPLLMIYAANDKTAVKKQDKLDEIETRSVIISLQLVLVSLLRGRPKRLSDFDVAIHFSRLMTVFIASSSLFLESEVQDIMGLILVELLKDCRVPSFDRSRPVPGIDDMTDFYRQLVAQHAAVSYGNDLFSLFVLLPTGGKNGQLKDVLWLDNQDLLGAIKITTHQLSAVGITIESFIDSPEDTSVDRIRAYACALITGRVDANRQSALFSIAKGNITWALQRNDPELKKVLNPLFERLTLIGIE